MAHGEVSNREVPYQPVRLGLFAASKEEVKFSVDNACQERRIAPSYR
ncbi:hypothetical protein ACPOL_6651 [Acidisarcina polymorpha]|uniref:Uncharacterized protein n=1 Tax=Acidisarcina polymorpha TaxID=2211140 RepID=A0A2Z5G9D3_9BACT|nr:hypothetical protein ACPOL_6651 [Acidisarcina polymorpha]